MRHNAYFWRLMNLNQNIGVDLQELMDHLPVVVFEYTFFPDGYTGFTYISPRCEELIGLPQEVIMEGELSLESFIHPDDLMSFKASIKRSVTQFEDWAWKGRCKGKNGFLWIETKSSPTRMKDGRIVYHGVFSDMRERKSLEDKQLLTEQKYRNLVEQLPLGIVILAKGKIRFVNTSAAKLIGAQSMDELIEMDMMQFVHPDSRAFVRSRIEQVLAGHPTEPQEVKLIKLNGQDIFVESSGHLYLYEGEPAVQVILTDLTERKKAEASFRKTETLFFQLFQNTPLAIVLLNEKSEVVQINKGFEELFGYQLNELRSRTLTEAIVPVEMEQEGNEINDMISKNKVIQTETVRQSKDKRRVPVMIYGFPVVLHDQKIGIFGMYVDMSERQKVEEELKVRNAELDNFVYKVSHDLRAPLSSVLGLAHLASIPGNTDDLGNYIKLMGQKAAQLDHFISDVLSHSKNLKMEVKVEYVDLWEIIASTFQGLSYLEGAEQVVRNIIIQGGRLFSDPWRIAEIFRNLISNSIKYRREDCEITILINVMEDQCSIIFEDNGVGIGQEHLSRIFEMFYRASSQSNGSGLGLYIVKNAIDKLAGSVTVESKLGKGTRFEISVPNRREPK